MEKEQFVFTGLNWMTPEKIENLNRSLTKLNKYGIEHDFRKGTKGTRLIISGYTDILENRYCDDNITFLCKFQGYCGDETDEDTLLIFTIDDDMNIKAKVLNYCGGVENINL